MSVAYFNIRIHQGLGLVGKIIKKKELLFSATFARHDSEVRDHSENGRLFWKAKVMNIQSYYVKC